MVLARRSEGPLGVRRHPLSEFNRLMGDLDAFMERAFAALPQLDTWTGAFTPLADIEETDDAYVIEIELPGIKREDASVEVQGRRVVVTGERKERERKGVFRTKARVTGRFHFEALLPGDIDPEQVTANYDDGVLVVRAPKPESERSQARKIEIQ